MKKYKNYYKKIVTRVSPGFVLPYTLFICSIMILITTSVSSILIKQLYFSKLARQSQAAYYAADNAILCTAMIDETYTDIDGIGIFPYKKDPVAATPIDDMEDVLDYVNDHRVAGGYSELAGSLNDIRCAQSDIFDTSPLTSEFTVSPTIFSRLLPDMVTIEEGRTSTFDMKMNLGDGTFFCAKVTVNKTATYRQIIAQGYALCDRPEGSVERAVINTTIIQ